MNFFSYKVIGPIFILYVATVLFIVVYRISLRPTREASRLGMRGLKRQRALLHSGWWPDVEPLVRWMGVRLSQLPSDAMRANFDQRLIHAGDFLGLSADELLACMVLCGGMGLFAGILTTVFTDKYGTLPIVMGTVMGTMMPLMRLDSAKGERMKSINRGLPYAIDLIALSMSAGADFPGSVKQVIVKSKAKDDALIDELGYMLQQLDLGRTRTQALREFMSRTPSEPVAEFVQSVVQAEERGNPVAAVLAIQAEVARSRRTTAAEKNASDMKTKMALPTMMMMGIVLTFVGFAMSSMMSTFTSSNPTGMTAGSSGK